jgi:hypothetical protein
MKIHLFLNKNINISYGDVEEQRSVVRGERLSFCGKTFNQLKKLNIKGYFWAFHTQNLTDVVLCETCAKKNGFIMKKTFHVYITTPPHGKTLCGLLCNVKDVYWTHIDNVNFCLSKTDFNYVICSVCKKNYALA